MHQSKPQNQIMPGHPSQCRDDPDWGGPIRVFIAGLSKFLQPNLGVYSTDYPLLAVKLFTKHDLIQLIKAEPPPDGQTVVQLQ